MLESLFHFSEAKVARFLRAPSSKTCLWSRALIQPLHDNARDRFLRAALDFASPFRHFH